MTQPTRRVGTRAHGSRWPSKQQSLLFELAVSPDARAARAWDTLVRRLDLQELEPGGFALLPAAYRRAARLGADGELLARLKGVYRSTWYKNNLLERRRAGVTEALADSGIAALATDGLTLAKRFYDDLGARPTPHLELLVPASRLAGARSALLARGWRERAELGTPGRRHVFDHDGKARCIVARDEEALPPHSLTTTIAAEIRRSASLEAAPDGARPTATDALLLAFAEATRPASAPSVQWLLDGAMIATDEIDWERVVHVAVSTGWALVLRDAVLWLRHLGVAVPDDTTELLSARAHRREKIARTAAFGLPHALGACLASTAGEGPAGTMRQLPRSLRLLWHVGTARELSSTTLRRSARLAARAVHRA